MANKKLSELTTKTSIGSSDLFPIADATTGQLYKKTVSDLAVAIGGGVSSVNTLTGVEVLNADNIAEASSPTNKYFTDLRARGAISAGTGISYNSSTGVITNTGQPLSTNLTSLAGLSYASTSFVKMTASGTFSLDTNTYLTISSAASQYQTIGSYSTGFGTASRIPRWTTSSAFGLAQIWDDGTNIGIGATPGAFKLDVTGTARISSNITASSFIKSCGTSAQFLKADGSIDAVVYYPNTNPNGYTTNLGTVTNVSALTIGTSGSDISSSVANGSTTPTITLNIPTASSSNRGALSASDWTTFNGKKDSLNSFSRKTASYTLVLGDKDKVIEMNVGSANTLTIPTNASVAFTIGTEITIMQYGAGQTTIAQPGGVTIRSKGGYLKIADQYTGVTLVKVGTDEWYLIGNLAG
jgi:hypothetical protein